MKLVDPNRGKQEAEAIVKKIEVFAKKQYAEVDADYEGNTCYVQVNSPLQISDDMADFVTKSNFCTLISKREYKGIFDWASDTYIKECSTIEFKW